MRTTILLCFVLFQYLLPAQTYFYVNSIEVVPADPTTADAIILNIHGDLSSSGAYISNVDFSIQGTDVMVTIDAADPGGLAVLVPHTQPIAVGQLAAGTYTVTISGMNMSDFAPVPDHTFTVSAGGGSSCDSLEIVSIQYNAFSDTLINVSILNTGTEIFPYPGFILFNNDGDTIAMEEVNFFGIGTSSIHTLSIHPDADLTDLTFSGTLELWTDFYDTLACTLPAVIDLCPATCSTMIPYVMNQGGAIVTATFNYMISDQDGVVQSGALELNDVQQFDGDTLCLPPGNYTMTLVGGPVSGGQSFFGVSAPGSFDGPMTPINSTDPLEFEFDPLCIDIGQAIENSATDQPIAIFSDGQYIQIMRKDGKALNQIALIDVKGRTIGTIDTNIDRHALPLADLSSGMYVIKIMTEGELPFMHKFAHSR